MLQPEGEIELQQKWLQSSRVPVVFADSCGAQPRMLSYVRLLPPLFGVGGARTFEFNNVIKSHAHYNPNYPFRVGKEDLLRVNTNRMRSRVFLMEQLSALGYDNADVLANADELETMNHNQLLWNNVLLDMENDKPKTITRLLEKCQSPDVLQYDYSEKGDYTLLCNVGIPLALIFFGAAGSGDFIDSLFVSWGGTLTRMTLCLSPLSYLDAGIK